MMLRSVVLAMALTLAGCGGGGGGGGGGTSGLAFTSGASVSVPERTTGAFYTAAASGGGTLTFSIVGGADAARFALTGAGALSFVAAADFEAPTDANGDNVYLVTVQVSNGTVTR